MALTPEAARLTERHRRDQAAIRAAFAAEFTIAGRVLDPHRLDDTTPAWLSVAETLVAQSRAASARTSARYYDDHRRTELAALDHLTHTEPHAFRADPRTEPNLEALRTSLLVTGPSTIKRLTGQHVPVAEAARTALVRAEGAAARHVLDGGRDTVHHAAEADPVALGWVRVTDGNPCWFCAMLASRGPVYKTRESGTLRNKRKRKRAPKGGAQQLALGGTAAGKPAAEFDGFHDGCGCTVEPVYSLAAAWPGDGQRYAALWKDVAKGLPAEDARKAFRKAIDDQRATDAAPAPAAAAPRAAPEQEQLPLPAGRGEPEPAVPLTPPGVTGALDGVDLQALTDDALYELFGQQSGDPNTPEHVLEELLGEIERREAADEPEPEPEPHPLAGLDLTTLSEADLMALWRTHAPRRDVTDAVSAELNRRDTLAAEGEPEPEVPPEVEETPEQRRIDELLGKGWDYRDAYAEAYNLDPAELDRQERAAAVDADRRPGESRQKAVRRAYDEWVHTQYLAAENDTRGYLLSRAGIAAGIDPVELFSGTSVRARKYASEELKRWWEDPAHPRMTFTQFLAQVLGRESDKKAAARSRGQGNGRDFGL